MRATVAALAACGVWPLAMIDAQEPAEAPPAVDGVLARVAAGEPAPHPRCLHRGS